MNFKKKIKPRDQEKKKQEKKDVLEKMFFFEGRENVLNAFDS